MKKIIITIILFLLAFNILYGQEKNEAEKMNRKKMKVAAYLYFKYNAKEAIETYKSIFDAAVVCEYLYSEDMTQNQELVGKIFHAELKVGDLNLYISDSGEEPSFSSVKFVVEISDEGEARKCFEALARDGKIISDFTKMPFGPTIAEVEDKFGVKWDIVIC